MLSLCIQMHEIYLHSVSCSLISLTRVLSLRSYLYLAATVSTWNVEFSLLFLFINDCLVYFCDNCKLTSARPCRSHLWREECKRQLLRPTECAVYYNRIYDKCHSGLVCAVCSRARQDTVGAHGTYFPKKDSPKLETVPCAVINFSAALEKVTFSWIKKKLSSKVTLFHRHVINLSCNRDITHCHDLYLPISSQDTLLYFSTFLIFLIYINIFWYLGWENTLKLLSKILRL